MKESEKPPCSICSFAMPTGPMAARALTSRSGTAGATLRLEEYSLERGLFQSGAITSFHHSGAHMNHMYATDPILTLQLTCQHDTH